MNTINHVLSSFLLLYFIFPKSTVYELLIFSLIFGAAIDLDQFVGKKLGKPEKHWRTWVEEPFAIILLALPIGIILSFFKTEYLFMTIIPYALHTVKDYMTIHEVSPLEPFNKKTIDVGFFKSFPNPGWYSGKEKGISENYFTLLLIIIFAFIFLI